MLVLKDIFMLTISLIVGYVGVRDYKSRTISNKAIWSLFISGTLFNVIFYPPMYTVFKFLLLLLIFSILFIVYLFAGASRVGGGDIKLLPILFYIIPFSDTKTFLVSLVALLVVFAIMYWKIGQNKIPLAVPFSISFIGSILIFAL